MYTDIKTSFTIVATSLVLASVMVNVIDATQPIDLSYGIPQFMRGLKQSDSTYSGTYNGQRVRVSCYEDIALDQIYKMKDARNTNPGFYKMCMTLDRKSDKAPLIKAIGCPLESYIDERKRRCYIEEIPDQASIFLDGVIERFKADKRGREIRDKFINQLIQAHKYANSLQWYLSWNSNHIAITDNGDLKLYSELYRMDAQFSIPEMVDMAPIVDPKQKIALYKRRMTTFLAGFYNKWSYPNENVNALVQNIMNILLAPPKKQ
ncbi:hypothetical protein BDF22DRAFT_676419 [Syncephalis plumigaleata]|nr:hypothetical protein BDF22DRAFT_676419 [Syncephalis plumigaleata]